MAAKIKLSIAKIEGQGVDIQRVVDGLRNMKAELQSLGCKVSVKVEGIELEAGNGVRTRDLLLGKKSVMAEGETVATYNPDLICEHLEIPDNICCEFCNAYPNCPLHFRREGQYIE